MKITIIAMWAGVTGHFPWRLVTGCVASVVLAAVAFGGGGVADPAVGRESRAAATTPLLSMPTAVSDCLFRWAEQHYSYLFSPAGAPSSVFAPYYYRYYSSTGNYLAVSSDDEHVWMLGPATNGQVLDLGSVSDLRSLTSCADEAGLGSQVSAVIGGQVYVVYSSLSTLADRGREVFTANIYVIRGATLQGTTNVWIFGAGYGDSGGDVLAYRGDRDAMRSAADDVDDVHRVITVAFGLTPAEVTVRFLVPHFHLDHFNQEFFTALFARGYSRTQFRAYIHALDRLDFGSCRSPCCGATLCGPQHPMFGAPYASPLEEATLNSLESLGTSKDTCNTELLSFDSPSGRWQLRKEAKVADGGHTDGNVNLDNVAVGVRILGGAEAVCRIPTGVARILHPHGRLD